MNLHRLEAGLARTAGAGYKLGDDLADSRRVERARYGVLVTEWDG